jgi:disulfide bond formation protein DsbB
MTHDVIVAFAVLGIVGQVVVGVFLLAGVLALAGVSAPLALVRQLADGREVWSAFVVAALATGGSLFISQVAGYQPCTLCWYQRICMYPLSILLLLFAWQGERWRIGYLLPFPLVGAGLAVYHLLIVNGAVQDSGDCFNSLKHLTGVVHGTRCKATWITEFGYVTIPILTLTSFLLLLGFFLLALTADRPSEGATPVEESAA